MSQRTSLIVGIALIVFSFFTVSQNSSVLASWLIDRSGTLVEVDPAVLGDSDDNNDSDDADDDNDNDDNDVEEQRVETEKRALEIRTENAKKTLERQTEAREKTLEQNKQVRKSRIEVKGNRLEIRQELRDENGKTVRELKTELPENELLHIEREDGERLELKAREGRTVELKGERVRMRTNFPLTVGEDNALIITKKDGTQKTVTFLPDAAVANLEAKGFITDSTETNLEESADGTPVYKFEAQEEKKLFGLFRRQFKKSVEVSAETGEIVGEADSEPSAFGRFLSRFAF